MKKFKPNKHTKPLMYFDLKKGMWLCSAAVMKEAIKRGLPKGNVRVGKKLLTDTYDIALEELLE